MFQTKELGDSDKEFKIMVIKMLTEVGRTMHKQNENFNKDTEKNTKVSNKNHRTKEYKNCTKNSIEGVKQYTERSIRNSKLKNRQ